METYQGETTKILNDVQYYKIVHFPFSNSIPKCADPGYAQEESDYSLDGVTPIGQLVELRKRFETWRGTVVILVFNI